MDSPRHCRWQQYDRGLLVVYTYNPPPFTRKMDPLTLSPKSLVHSPLPTMTELSARQAAVEAAKRTMLRRELMEAASVVVVSANSPFYLQFVPRQDPSLHTEPATQQFIKTSSHSRIPEFLKPKIELSWDWGTTTCVI